MGGTGFLDGFEPKKGNFEPPAKKAGAKKATKPTKEPKQVKITESVKKVVQEKAKETEPQNVVVSDEWPQGDSDERFTPLPNANPAIQRMIASARVQLDQTHKFVLCGVSGPPKSGKSGGVLDSRTQEEIAHGAEIYHIDFDMGGISTVAAHHHDNPGIVVLNPWVFNYDATTRDSYDFPATFQKVIDILKEALAQTEYQRRYYAEHGEMPMPYLKTVVLDGADQWLHICETVMKIEDLELGVDGLDAAVYLRQHEKGDSKKKSVSRFNWNLRTIRYQVAIHLLRELCRLGVHCYIITHMKPGYDSTGNEVAGADKPKWHSDTEGQLQQVVYTELEEERNEAGELTGVVRAYGIVVANRTSLASPERFLIFERNADGGVWYGWPGIAEGDFTGGAE
jgi:hypothetical protein